MTTRQFADGRLGNGVVWKGQDDGSNPLGAKCFFEIFCSLLFNGILSQKPLACFWRNYLTLTFFLLIFFEAIFFICIFFIEFVYLKINKKTKQKFYKILNFVPSWHRRCGRWVRWPSNRRPKSGPFVVVAGGGQGSLWRWLRRAQSPQKSHCLGARVCETFFVQLTIKKKIQLKIRNFCHWQGTLTHNLIFGQSDKEKYVR